MTGARISIWFFVGLLLLVYGIIITGAGVYELSHPPEHLPVLFQVHASIWWGAFILALGAVYTFLFKPHS